MGQNCGFQAISLRMFKRIGLKFGMLMSTFRTYYILVNVCWFSSFMSCALHGSNMTGLWGLRCVAAIRYPWWRHQMETFSALLAICAGNSPVPGEFPTQRPVTWSFDIVFDLRPNKRLSKQRWGWWFETPSNPLWRHCNARSTSSSLSCDDWRNEKGKF